jgi:hypothetical protein
MPMKTKWVPPEVFLALKGVTVYRAYKDGDADHPLTYSFTTSEDPEKEDDCRFDARNLRTWKPSPFLGEVMTIARCRRAGVFPGGGEDRAIRRAVEKAVKLGHLVQDEPPKKLRR